MRDERAIPGAEAERLLRGVASGDEESLERLYRLARGAVYGYSLSILSNAADAEDVTQETFVSVWENAKSYDPGGSAMAWVLTIAKNRALSLLRRTSRVEDISEERWEALPAEESGVRPEDRLLLQDGLAALSGEERRVVTLHAVAGLKFREVASVLGVPISSAMSKYHRALKKLRVFLEGGAAL